MKLLLKKYKYDAWKIVDEVLSDPTVDCELNIVHNENFAMLLAYKKPVLILSDLL